MNSENAKFLKLSNNNKPCNHPHLEKEYILGASTGDYICTQCGESGWGSNWNKKEEFDKKQAQ
jgi:hypothetical protein